MGIITIFTIAGGMRGVVITDTIMMIVILVAASVMGPYIIKAAGGWPNAMKKAALKLPNFTD